MRVGPRSGSRILCLISLCVYLTPRLVIIGNDHRRPESCFPIWFYQRLPTPLTIPNTPTTLHENRPTKHYRNLCSRCEHHWCFWIGLPTVTILPDLGLDLPRVAFTKPYHLAITTGIIDCYNGLGTVVHSGERPT